MTPTHLSKTELYAQGWTRPMVNALLGPPDILSEKRTRAGWSYTSHLYAGSRVAEAEATPQFEALRLAEQQRRARLAEKRRKRIEKYLEQARTASINLMLGELEAVKAQAVTVVNNLAFGQAFSRYERGDGGAALDDLQEIKADEADPLWLERVTVNYVRHRLTNYHRLLKWCEKARMPPEVKEQAYLIIKRRVLETIAETEAYNYLNAECHRQLAELFEEGVRGLKA